MREGAVAGIAVFAIGCAGCQSLLNFDPPERETVIVVVASDSGALAPSDSGTSAIDAGSDAPAATGPCSAASIVYCADFDGPRLDAYGPFPSNGDYALTAGGTNGTTRLSVGPIASPVILHDLGAGAESYVWHLNADVGCRTDDTSVTGTRNFLGFVSTAGGVVPVLFCTRAAQGQGLQIRAGFWNVSSGAYESAVDVLNGAPEDGALRHVELMLQQSGSNVILSAIGPSGGSLPGSAALSSLRFATAISGTDPLTTYVDNLVLRRE